jgi:hypothetical protein
MRKMTAIVAGGIGYVLGARAGRERYEQIRRTAQRVRRNPTVQQTARQAAEAAKDAAPVVKDKVVSAADTAAQKVKPSSGGSSVPMDDSAYPTS